jgi:hypothetical protein
MQRIHFEFGRLVSHERRIAYQCLTVLLVLCGVSAFYYWKTTQSANSLGAQLLQNDHAPANPALAVVVDIRHDEDQRGRVKAARDVVERLRTPWPSLFAALEESSQGNVAVLRIEPDAAHQEVRITADASTMSHAVAYATRLQSTGALTRVYIANQHASTVDPLNPLQIVIMARWKTTNSAPEARSDRTSTQALNDSANLR